jgi:hypothetical protein
MREGRWAAPQTYHFQDHVIRVTGSNPAPHLLAAEREIYIYIYSARDPGTPIYISTLLRAHALPGPGRLPTGTSASPPVREATTCQKSRQLPESPPRPQSTSHQLAKKPPTVRTASHTESTSHQLSRGVGSIRASGGPTVPLIPTPHGGHPHPWLGLGRRRSKGLSATRTHTDPLCDRAPGSPPPLAAAPRK